MGTLRKLMFPVFLFLVFVILIIYHDGLLSKFYSEDYKILGQFIHYSLNIGLWITGAHLVNVLLRIFFWEGLVSRTIKGEVPRLLIHFFSLIVYLVALVIILKEVFNQPLTGIWATSGVLALVLGFALRNMILDLFTGLAVNIERPYEIGDWIGINLNNPKPDIYGQVIDINWRATRLRTEEEQIVIIPNSLLNTYIVNNFSSKDKKIRFETEIHMDYSMPVEQAKRILQSATKRILMENGFFTTPEPRVLANRTNEFGVQYLVRYWIEPWKGIYPTNARDVVNSSILESLYFYGLRPSYPKEEVYFSRKTAEIGSEDTVEKRLSLLSKVSLFSTLTAGEMNEIAGVIEHKSFKKGQKLIEKGEAGDSMFILSEGLLDVTVNSDSNSSFYKVSEIHPGQFFGEMSFLTGEPRSATVNAATDIIAYEVKKEHVEELFKQRPAILEDISEIVAERRSQNISKLEQLSTSDSADKTSGLAKNLLLKIKVFFS